MGHIDSPLTIAVIDCHSSQATPLVAGLAVAGAAFVAKQAVQTFIKLSASGGVGSMFSGSRAFYKVSCGVIEIKKCLGW